MSELSALRAIAERENRGALVADKAPSWTAPDYKPAPISPLSVPALVGTPSPFRSLR